MAASAAVDKPRSSFVLKLHQLLSAQQHPDYLHWLNNDTFAITSIDSQARVALAPQWDFRSLSSFIRQLSYYSFKRLSDRRRSAERRSSLPAFIVFTHPSGCFVRDDQNKAMTIQRKLRARKPTTKRKKNPADTNANSSATQDQDFQDGSASPEERGLDYDEEQQPTQTQAGLANYQLPAWNALEARGRTIRSSPRPIPGASMQQVPGYDGHSPYNTGYPSPVSAPSTSTFFPPAQQSAYYAAPGPSPNEAIYYYAAAPQQQTAYGGSHSPFAAYASNELPPLRTVTSGLVVPPSPPPEQYVATYSPQRAEPAVYQSQAHFDDEEKTPSPVADSYKSHAPLYYSTLPTQGAPLQANQQPHLVSNSYYPAGLTHQPHPSVAQSHLAQQLTEVKPFYHLAGENGVAYASAPLGAVSRA
ncbi:uncharacterized protein JCM10292_003031 [Rhodotorula paludigena]|uniref:uncharacterized protein n=1 Tax=Rhodotorula paludigena TaxID=86838 RepID=UPI00317E3A43